MFIKFTEKKLLQVASRYNEKCGEKKNYFLKSVKLRSLYIVKEKGQNTDLTSDSIAESRHTTRL